MMNGFWIAALTLIWTQAATATTADTPEHCKPVREAVVKARVVKLFWQKVDEEWEMKAEQLCQAEGKIGVLPGRAAGCFHQEIASCQVRLDGEMRALRLSGKVYHAPNASAAEKHFLLAYNVDREPWEGSSANASTRDLSLKQLSLRIQGPSPYPQNGKPLWDTLVVYADFEDTDAP